MRPALLAVPVLALSMATALAQTPPPTPSQKLPGATADSAPLMTAPRPDDTATTPPTSSPTGLGGAAPSTEMTGQAPSADNPDDVALAPGAMIDSTTARSLVGRDVQTRDGKAAGLVRDFTLAGPEGRIDRVVLGSGAFMGPETELVSVPASELRLDAPESQSTPPAAEKPTTRLSLDMTAEELKKAPAFAYDAQARTLVGNR